MIARASICLALTALPAFAQTVITSPIDGSETLLELPEEQGARVLALDGDGAALRGLDKVSGDVVDIDVRLGETANLGRIGVTLEACRFPEDNQTGEAFAWLKVTDPRRDVPLFEGWMSATSPALNALDHPRYDVWVIRCTSA